MDTIMKVTKFIRLADFFFFCGSFAILDEMQAFVRYWNLFAAYRAQNFITLSGKTSPKMA